MEKFNELSKEQRQMLVGMLVNHVNGENKPEIGQVVLAHSKLILSMIIKYGKMVKRIDALEEEIERLKNNE